MSRDTLDLKLNVKWNLPNIDTGRDMQQFSVGLRKSQSFSGAALSLKAQKRRCNVPPIIGPPADTYSTDDSCGKLDDHVKCTRQAELVIESIHSSIFKPWAFEDIYVQACLSIL